MDIGAWLRDLGLQRYEAAFRDHDVDREILPKLTAEDLLAIGVTSVGHRRRLLEAIAALAAPVKFAAAVTANGTEDRQGRKSEAERRQLTVLFCDLVGSTELSGRLDAIAEALALVASTNERFYEAEIYRVKGELLLKEGGPDSAAEAEASFRQALDVAPVQSAKSWELRAAMSLARLWAEQGQRAEAHDLLAPVYGWFTEGSDTADLKDAKAMLDELR